LQALRAVLHAVFGNEHGVVGAVRERGAGLDGEPSADDGGGGDVDRLGDGDVCRVVGGVDRGDGQRGCRS